MRTMIHRNPWCPEGTICCGPLVQQNLSREARSTAQHTPAQPSPPTTTHPNPLLPAHCRSANVDRYFACTHGMIYMHMRTQCSHACVAGWSTLQLASATTHKHTDSTGNVSNKQQLVATTSCSQTTIVARHIRGRSTLAASSDFYRAPIVRGAPGIAYAKHSALATSLVGEGRRLQYRHA